MELSVVLSGKWGEWVTRRSRVQVEQGTLDRQNIDKRDVEDDKIDGNVLRNFVIIFSRVFVVHSSFDTLANSIVSRPSVDWQTVDDPRIVRDGVQEA